MRLLRWFWLGLLVTLSGCAHPATARSGVDTTEARVGRQRTRIVPAPAPLPYTRKFETTNGTVGLEVALRRFNRPGSSARGFPDVWLVGVTHLGTSNYYARLQRFLDGQTLVLFEGIGATNGNFRALKKPGFSLQPALARALGLRFQLTSVDYRRPNWINSDLSERDLERHLPADGKTTSMDQLMAAFQGEGQFGGVARLGVALLGASPRLQSVARLMLIETLSNFTGDLPDGADFGIDTRELMRVLIEERNAVVVRDLTRALGRLRRPARIAIFYGAGHMPDLEMRLRRDLGLQPVEDQWLRAFSVNPARSGMSQAEVDLIRDSVREGMEKK